MSGAPKKTYSTFDVTSENLTKWRKKGALSLLLLFLFITVLLSSCSVSKFIPDDKYILNKVSIKTDTKGFDIASLEPYIRQRANSRWFSAFKIPLATYSLAGRDTTKWINRTLQRIGEEPVIFDTLQARLSIDDLREAMFSMGYMNADVVLSTKIKGKKLKAVYTLYPHDLFKIGTVQYDIRDDSIAKLMNDDKAGYFPQSALKTGAQFNVSALDAERKRITYWLQDKGYYKFHKDFIQYSADSSRQAGTVDLILHLLKYRAGENQPERLHQRFHIGNVNFLSTDSTQIHIRKNVLNNATALAEGDYFSATNLQRTYNNFARLKAVRYTNIRLHERQDTTLLDCDIQIGTLKPSTISIQPEGTNTAGDLGAALSITYENRNLFRGSEALSVKLRGAFEAITGLEGYQNKDYEEYGVETRLSFPRLLAPMLSSSLRRRSDATSELSVSWDMQNRPEFHRRVFSTTWRYRWTTSQRKITWRLDLPDLNYVHMPWIAATFKEEYLDNASSRNAILRYNYENLFIMKVGLGMTYMYGNNILRTNIETAGNLLDGIARLSKRHENAAGQRTLLGIAYAQYAKVDVDYTRKVKTSNKGELALHAAIGIACPFGNSKVLPFEKRYFAGGANSVRGWSVRRLGPGRFKGTDGRIDFINQTGDIKLDLNAEWRMPLFWKFQGALFIDAGNIWTMRHYNEQEGGQFKFNSFYKEIAAAYGAGIRLNFDYFIIRFDAGMKAIDPSVQHGKEHWPVIHPDVSRDFAFHFAVGLPF